MYQRRVVEIIEDLKKEGKNVGRIANKVERATAKHEEVWKSLIEIAGEQAKPRVDEFKDDSVEFNLRIQRVLEREN